MNRLRRVITEEEENFVTELKNLTENVAEVKEVVLCGSILKGTGLKGVSDLDLWIITTSPNYTEDDLKNLIPAEKYEVNLVQNKNRVLITIKKKCSKMDTVDATIIPDLTLSNLDITRPVQSGGYILHRIVMIQLYTMDKELSNLFKDYDESH